MSIAEKTVLRPRRWTPSTSRPSTANIAGRYATGVHSMGSRSVILIALLCSLAASARAADPSSPAGAPSAAEQMSRPGPEETALSLQVGTWEVVASLWPAPDAQPIVSRGLVAQRSMIGRMLQEVMQPAPGSAVPDFRRLDYLDYDRVEGRWKYVSMDTRFPVSIMPAWSSGPAQGDSITLQFQPQAFVGFGSAVEGRFMISDMVVSTPAPDRVVKEQHVTMADGTGRRWLFVRYEYMRRP